MIAILGDFRCFFGKNLSFFLKAKCNDLFSAHIAVILGQNLHFFLFFFGGNIFKIITLIPGLDAVTLIVQFSLDPDASKHQLLAYIVHLQKIYSYGKE
jgi:hypothetical protein